MTIAISVLVGEGLVYAADSTSTQYAVVNGTPQVAQSWHHAQKLLQVSDYPVGVLTFGLGQIGSRNLESLMLEFEAQNDLRSVGGPWTVQGLAEKFRDFLVEKYNAAWPPPGPEAPDNRSRLGVVVGGYSHGSYVPQEVEFLVPDGSVFESRQAGRFGVRWWGQTEYIDRLMFGFDYSKMLMWLLGKGFSDADAESVCGELLEQLRWRVSFEGMPRQDAIDLAVYLANIEIGRGRFGLGPALCGGPIDVATIAAGSFDWIRRKQYRVKSRSVFY